MAKEGRWFRRNTTGRYALQEAETVLNVIRERGERELPLENIYRLLYNRNLYLRAYGRLYSNQGATTKGTTPETVDGMSLVKIDRIIEALRYERFRWTPVRRQPSQTQWGYPSLGHRRGRTSCCKRPSG